MRPDTRRSRGGRIAEAKSGPALSCSVPERTDQGQTRVRIQNPIDGSWRILGLASLNVCEAGPMPLCTGAASASADPSLSIATLGPNLGVSPVFPGHQCLDVAGRIRPVCVEAAQYHEWSSDNQPTACTRGAQLTEPLHDGIRLLLTGADVLELATRLHVGARDITLVAMTGIGRLLGRLPINRAHDTSKTAPLVDQVRKVELNHLVCEVVRSFSLSKRPTRPGGYQARGRSPPDACRIRPSPTR